MFIMHDENGQIVGAGTDSNMLAKSFSRLKEQEQLLAKSKPAKPVLLTKSSGASNSPFSKFMRDLEAVRRQTAVGR